MPSEARSKEREEADPRASAPTDVDASETLAGFRQAMRRHAAGVCIISAGEGDAVNGMAVTSATSFSFEPPSVLVCVNETASIAALLGEGDTFGLTVLGAGHEAVAAAFSRKPSGRPRFDHGPWRLQAGEPPWLEDAPANLTCLVERTVVYGTHRAVIGRVRFARLGPAGPSLVYRDGRYD